MEEAREAHEELKGSSQSDEVVVRAAQCLEAAGKAALIRGDAGGGLTSRSTRTPPLRVHMQLLHFHFFFTRVMQLFAHGGCNQHSWWKFFLVRFILKLYKRCDTAPC